MYSRQILYFSVLYLLISNIAGSAATFAEEVIADGAIEAFTALGALIAVGGEGAGSITVRLRPA